MGKNVRNFEIIIWDIERKKVFRVLPFKKLFIKTPCTPKSDEP